MSFKYKSLAHQAAEAERRAHFSDAAELWRQAIDAAGKNGGTTSQERAELGALLHRSARFLSADEVQRYQQAIDDLSPAQEAAC
ncbi:TPA: ANR family transcriptional regulator [Serratia marcescens]